jgi:mono/diheme cytochrome c family protein
MNKSKIFFISILVLILSTSYLLAACGSSSPTPAPATSGGATPAGQTLMQQRCTACHSLSRITSAQKSADQWKVTVDRMIGKGAQLSPAEEQTLVNYLAQTYHP